MSIGQRLREERERLGYTQPVFAELASTTKKSQIDYEKDITQPKASYLADIAQVGADINYIVTGQKVNRDEPIIDEFAKIPVYDVEASAGHGSFFNNENILYHMAYRKEWLKNRGLTTSKLGVIIVNGDSMQPTLNDRESILINFAETTPKDGHIYVVRSDDVLWVKRVQRLPNNKILLISDNPFYPAMTLNLEQDNLQVIGKVVNSSRNFY